MKKSTIAGGVIVIVAAAYLGATWYIGKRTQTFTEHAVAQANARMASMLGTEAERSGARLELDSYDRGFFSSVVDYSLHVKDHKGKPAQIRLQDHIAHGPFPWRAIKAGHFEPLLAHSETRLVATPITQAWVDSQNGDSPLIGHTDVALSGNGSSVWTFRPANFAAADGIQVDFSGGRLQVDFSNEFRDNDTEGHFDAFALTDAASGGQVTLRDIAARSQMRAGADNSSKSESTADIGQVHILNKSRDEDFTLGKVVVKLDSEQNGKLANTLLRYDFGSLLIGQTNLGSLSLGGQVRDLDIPALVALGNEYDAIVARHGGQDERDIDLTPQEQQALETKAMAVLASNPSITIDPVLWKNGKGETTARLEIDLTRPAHAAGAPGNVIVPEYVRKLKLGLAISRPMVVELFGQMRQDAEERDQLEMMGGLLYDQYVSRLEQAQLIKVSEQRATTDIVYENDAVIVNGNSMPVQEFLLRAMTLMM